MTDIAEAFEPEEYAEQKEHYRIDGAKSASWALRKLATVREKRLAGCRLALDEMERIKAWQDHLDVELDRDETYFSAILRNWHEEQLAADPKAKTISLPGGKLIARKSPDRVEVDDDTFLTWAQHNLKEAVQVTLKPKKDAIRKHLDSTGEILPGVSVIKGELNFKAETS